MFLINVPVVLIGLIAAFELIPESRALKRPGFDLVGVATSIGGLLALIYGLIEAGRHGFSYVGALLAIVCGIAILVGFVSWERRLSRRPDGQPLLDLALFGLPSYTWGVILTTIADFTVFGVLFTMPQYFQGVLGTNAMGSGLRLLPLMGGLVLGAAPSDRIAHLVGAKVAVAFGFAMLAAGLLLGTSTSVSSPGLFLAAWMGLVGAGMGLTLATGDLVRAIRALPGAKWSGIGGARGAQLNGRTAGHGDPGQRTQLCLPSPTPPIRAPGLGDLRGPTKHLRRGGSGTPDQLAGAARLSPHVVRSGGPASCHMGKWPERQQRCCHSRQLPVRQVVVSGSCEFVA